MKFDQSIRVVTTFFAAVIGFGLKHILDEKPSTDLGMYKWALFIIAVLLFLRFLTGSANHLWFEHIKHPKDKFPHALLVRDLGFLIVFGFYAASICYANSVTRFLLQSLSYLGVAIGWALIVGH